MNEASIPTTTAASPQDAYMDLIYSKAMVRTDVRQLVDSIVSHPQMNPDDKLGLLREVAGVTEFIRSFRSAALSSPKAA